MGNQGKEGNRRKMGNRGGGERMRRTGGTREKVKQGVQARKGNRGRRGTR